MRILTLSGSLRAASFNTRLLRLAAPLLVQRGAEVEHLDIRALGMPLLDQDLEQASGLPAGGEQLRRALHAADAVLLAAPEYNGSLTAALKNAIDWSTRDGQGGGDTTPWQNQIVALTSASPGAYGGMRGLAHLRTVLAGIGALVLPGTLSVPAAHTVLTSDDPAEVDAALLRRLERVLDALVAQCRLHAGTP